ncbi:histidine-type phosphatase [Dysgonomonas sp. ZJ709]|uniref:histidine-type phosphatase n=1 Tax=Dysgonomonas sp. ZJ709 TaxID=2709797 RepID=UPI0013EBF48C
MKRLNMKNLCFLVLFLFLSFCPVFGQTSKQEMFDTPEKTGGVYYAYPENYRIAQTPVPKGYEPFYISHFGRHGSRYLINDEDYKWVLDLLADAKKNQALTPLGEDAYNRLAEVWIEAEGHGGDLSPLGVRQHRDIAERMYKAYPQVFNNNVEISARSTVVIRCVLSMDAFCERLKEINPTLRITREASNKYMNYLNYHTEEAMAFTSRKGPWYEEYRKFEESHTRPDRLISSLFSDTTYIKKKVNPAPLMWALYWIASDMQNMETDLSFYDLFEKEELFDLWEVVNYRLYVCDATSALNGGIMMENSKPVLKNILDSANEIISTKGKGATLRFAHDGNIIPLAAILHLQDCYASISEPSDFYKVWSNFKMAPMAGNIQIVFFQKKGSDDVLVKFLLNEKEILIPPVNSDVLPYYHWKDVEAFYKSLLAE